jgi:hypothetical protein
MSQQESLDSHRYERLDESQLRDSIAKAEAQDERLGREGTPEQIAEHEARKEDLRAKLNEVLDERRAGPPAEGAH